MAINAPNTANVSTGKAKVGGAIFRAPVGTVLPTDPKTTLNTGFVGLGYASDAGLVNSSGRETTTVKAWGGDIVSVEQTEKTDTFKVTLIETLNTDVLKTLHGSARVKEASGVTSVEVSSDSPEAWSWVFDMILKGGKLKRIVIPEAYITEVGDITYVDGEVTGFEITLTAMSNAQGVTHYEYISAPATTSGN